MYYTVYKVTNKINDKFYIGVHKTEDLEDDYMGSGKYLRHSIKKYGIENFTKEILHVFGNPEEMFSKEAEIVNEKFLSEGNTYNLRLGGEGGWDYVNKKGRNVYGNNGLPGFGGENLISFVNIKEKMIKENRWDKHLKNLSEITKNWIKNNGHPFEGKTHSKETKKLISEKNKGKGKKKENSQFGTKWICNVDLKENKKIKKDDPLPEGWILGRNKWNLLHKERIKKEAKKVSEKKKESREEKLRKETLHYWDLFKRGNYSSVREFCREVYPKSHVIFTKHLKKFVEEYDPSRGKNFSSK